MKTNEPKKRRQVSFNIDDALYTSYKKIMLDERTTPTADITRYIQKRVDDANKSDKGEK